MLPIKQKLSVMFRGRWCCRERSKRVLLPKCPHQPAPSTEQLTDTDLPVTPLITAHPAALNYHFQVTL